MNNTTIAALFITLAVISVGVNGWFLFITTGDTTGHASATARACLNMPPIPNASGCGYATELMPYSCTITTFDAGEANSRTFLDNTSLFNITNTGLMSFYPLFGQRGSYPIEITVIDDSGCSNSVQSTTFTLIILPYPANDSLVINDSTKENLTYKFDPVLFTANYSDVNTNASIVGADCKIHYDYQNLGPLNMTYNATTGLYERNEYSGFLQGTYDYNVTCDGIGIDYGLQTRNDTFTITNRPPYLFADFPNLTIQAGRSVSGYDLNDYFKDNDFDTLTFTDTSTSVIDIEISALGLVTITPNPTIQGNYTVRFRASDGIDQAQSNPFIITVLPRTFPPPDSGGGGGGGGGASQRPPPFCTPEWECSEWERCEPTGIQQRTCKDLNQCANVDDKPEEVRDCEYVGTCTDNLKNCHSGMCELGVDCGGPCDPCASCFDGIQNQDETGVDCGGVCDACTEEGIGPETDRPSPLDQIPEDVRRASYITLFVGLIATILAVLASLYLHKNVFRLVGKWASNLVAPPERQVSEHAQYVIAIEVLYDRFKRSKNHHEFLSGVADRTSELLAWVLGVDAEYTFEEIREAASNSKLSKKQINHIDSYTRLLETGLYGAKSVVKDHALLRGARSLAEHLKSTEVYAREISAARELKRSIRERLLGHLNEAFDVLLEHKRMHAAELLIAEADALAEGLKKGDVLERYQALRAKVIE